MNDSTWPYLFMHTHGLQSADWIFVLFRIAFSFGAIQSKQRKKKDLADHFGWNFLSYSSIRRPWPQYHTCFWIWDRARYRDSLLSLCAIVLNKYSINTDDLKFYIAYHQLNLQLRINWFLPSRMVYSDFHSCARETSSVLRERQNENMFSSICCASQLNKRKIELYKFSNVWHLECRCLHLLKW